MAKPNRDEEQRLRAIAIGGRDDDLPNDERRTRAEIGGGLSLGDTVVIDGLGEVVVLGPGRGRGYFVGGYTTDQERLCIQTFRVPR